MFIELDQDVDFDFNMIHKVFDHCKTVKNSKACCVVCGLDEFDNENNNEIWDRYLLPCRKHQAHTRCFRRWMGHKQNINCPWCGDISETEANKYCANCDAWGHSSLNHLYDWVKPEKTKRKQKKEILIRCS